MADQTARHAAPPGGTPGGDAGMPSECIKVESNIDKLKPRIVMNSKPLKRISLFLTVVFVMFLMHAMDLLKLRYIANELDGVANTVVVFGIWAHLETFPVQIYIRRLMSIRRVGVRLLARAQDTVVLVRNANPKNLALFDSQTNSDWYSARNNKALAATSKGLNVHLVDAWEMTLAPKLPHLLHPEPPIIHNMMNVILTSVCSRMR